MNAFEKLLKLSAADKKRKGVEHTPREIAQQPSTWKKTAGILRARRKEIAAFMTKAGMIGKAESNILLTGAGTSQFVGDAIANVMRKRLKREVASVPTTDFVTHARELLVPGHRYVLVSFARSGNSPESVATYELVKKRSPQSCHVIITCNGEGKLAKAAAKNPKALCIVLPPETNDLGLAMTSSFSTMAFTGIGLCFINEPGELSAAAARLGAGANRVMKVYADLLADLARQKFSRACFLGSGVLAGTMQECRLKLQEMTEGRVACMAASYVGLRHGPQVFVNKECAVIAALSSDTLARKYEMDLLRELRAKRQGCCLVVVCDKTTPEIRNLRAQMIELYPAGKPVEDDFRVMTDVVVGQILATFKSLNVGLMPDNPSVSGTISRVVQGVVIYKS